MEGNWSIIDTLFGLEDRQTDLRNSMAASLHRLAELTETSRPSPTA